MPDTIMDMDISTAAIVGLVVLLLALGALLLAVRVFGARVQDDERRGTGSSPRRRMRPR